MTREAVNEAFRAMMKGFRMADDDTTLAIEDAFNWAEGSDEELRRWIVEQVVASFGNKGCEHSQMLEYRIEWLQDYVRPKSAV